MWAGRLGWPPHPCPCRSALQKLQPKLALRFRPHVAAVQTDHRRAHAADLHACAEPFYDSAWLSNSSSRSLSAGEWDKTPLPAHSPICRCSGMCNIRSPFSTWTRPGHRRTRVGAEEAIIPWPLLSVGTSEPVSTQAADTNINPNATMNAMRIQASPRPCSGSGWRWWHRSILRAALIVLAGVPPT